MKKDNPIIEDILISEEQLAEYKSRLVSRSPRSPIPLSELGKLRLAKEYLGGICCICGNIMPSKILKYDISDGDGDGYRIERYCDNCFQKWLTEDKDDNNKVKLLDTGQRNETIAVKDSNGSKNEQ